VSARGGRRIGRSAARRSLRWFGPQRAFGRIFFLFASRQSGDPAFNSPSAAGVTMSISFQCTSCDTDFDLEIPRIIDRPTALKCPNCNARPPAHRASALGTALEDLLSAMAAIRTKIRFEISLDTEELPPPYGPTEAGSGLSALTDELDDDDVDLDDDEDEDEDEDADEDGEDDFDADDEDEDDDEEDEDEEEEEDGGGDDDFEDDDEDDDDEEEEEEEEED
jgi:hypothetical protein